MPTRETLLGIFRLSVQATRKFYQKGLVLFCKCGTNNHPFNGLVLLLILHLYDLLNFMFIIHYKLYILYVILMCYARKVLVSKDSRESLVFAKIAFNIDASLLLCRYILSLSRQRYTTIDMVLHVSCVSSCYLVCVL